MLTNYLKIAWRNLVRNKVYASINVLGLALSLTCGILIFTLVAYHYGVDRFHTNADRLYRVVMETHHEGIGYCIPSLLWLFGQEFVRLTLIAIVIASPIAWYTMNQWLQGFTYKISIEWWMFAISALLAVGIALLTVSFQSVKAALMNPVKSLKTE